MSPESGDAAPDFTLESDDQGPITLSDLKGRRVVLYFYPKDDTPGCTVQACDFRDALPRFENVDAVILGVSPDDVTSHRAFREKFELTFPLLADVERTVAAAYGVLIDRVVNGVTVKAIQRSTFLIGADGTIERVWRGVTAQGHAEMLAGLLEG